MKLVCGGSRKLSVNERHESRISRPNADHDENLVFIRELFLIPAANMKEKIAQGYHISQEASGKCVEGKCSSKGPFRIKKTFSLASLQLP